MNPAGVRVSEYDPEPFPVPFPVGSTDPPITGPLRLVRQSRPASGRFPRPDPFSRLVLFKQLDGLIDFFFQAKQLLQTVRLQRSLLHTLFPFLSSVQTRSLAARPACPALCWSRFVLTGYRLPCGAFPGSRGRRFLHSDLGSQLPFQTLHYLSAVSGQLRFRQSSALALQNEPEQKTVASRRNRSAAKNFYRCYSH